MRRFGESESKYLKGSDLRQANGAYVAPIVTIESVTVETIGDDKEDKYILYFVGKDKGMVLNVTNEQLLIGLFGEPDGEPTQFFSGKQVQLYFDPSVMYGGKRIGGLRLREVPAAPAQAPAPPPEPTPPAPEPEAAPDGDIPF